MYEFVNDPLWLIRRLTSVSQKIDFSNIPLKYLVNHRWKPELMVLRHQSTVDWQILNENFLEVATTDGSCVVYYNGVSHSHSTWLPQKSWRTHRRVQWIVSISESPFTFINENLSKTRILCFLWLKIRKTLLPKNALDELSGFFISKLVILIIGFITWILPENDNWYKNKIALTCTCVF